MSSPFPGMDPYLEEHWRDVHASLVLYARNQLQPQLGPSLRARVEERLIVDSVFNEREHGIYPDIRVVERPAKKHGVTPALGVTVAEPLIIHRLDESHTEGYVQIIDAADGNRVVTVIEILSPTNKIKGSAQEEYRQKQRELLDGGVGLVEIDLLRSGKRILQISDFELPPSERQAYAACVRRGSEHDRYAYYSMPLRQKLSAIRIPLRAADPDVVLDIQSLVNQAYADGAYDDIDYSRPPSPPLDLDDSAWAEELIRNAGKY